MNNKFWQSFNELSENKFSYLRLGNVDMDENPEKSIVDVTITYIVPYEIYNDPEKFNSDIKAEIENLTIKLLPENVRCKIKYSQLQISDMVVKKLVNDFIKDNYIRLLNSKYLPNEIVVDINKDIVNIQIPVEESIKYYSDNQIRPEMEEFLNSQYNAQNVIKFKPVTIKKDEEFKINQTMKIVDDGMVELKEKGKLVKGKYIPDPPLYISKYIRPVKDATICGEITEFEKKVSKAGKLYYTIIVKDPTDKTMKCMSFANRAQIKKTTLDQLKVGDQIIVNGDLIEDSMSKKLLMFINNVLYCQIDTEKTLQKIEYFKKLVKKTKLPEPEPYEKEVEDKQITLFDEVPYICPLLRDKTFTVFDLETTGLITNGIIPNIVEIGAVRIQNGEIVSQFSTLVDPEMPIPFAASQTNHITDSMVEDAPLIKDAIGPFLKYAQNTILVGHNIAKFDIPIIKHFAIECGYKFDFNLLDTLQMAQQSGLKFKNFSLGTTCKYFNIENEDAHRALADTVANAKLFIALSNYMKMESL